MNLIAIQLQIALLTQQITQLRAELPPAYVQMVDWTPYEIATRVIPASEDQPQGND
jgi:hypothetical protein